MQIKDKIYEHLMKEYYTRLARNCRYSLRSYAKFLEVDPSLLSKIFNQKRSLSNELAENILRKIPSEELSLELADYLKKYRERFNQKAIAVA